MHTTQNMSFHLQRWENVGTQAIHQDHWSFHLYLSQCHLLHNLHSLQKVIHRRNRETTRPPFPSWRRERRQKTPLNRSRDTNLSNYSKQHMAVCGLSPHQGSTESRKTLRTKIFVFNIGLLILTVSTNAFHSTNLLFFTLPCTNQ